MNYWTVVTIRIGKKNAATIASGSCNINDANLFVAFIV
jgi:hypothetical protein